MSKSSLHPTVERELEASLAKQHEGKVFVSVYMIHMGGHYFMHRDYYHVKDGKIYMLHQTRPPELSDDTFLNLIAECHEVGNFNPEYKYASTSREYTYKQIKRLL